jgi:two-component system response regulator DegU
MKILVVDDNREMRQTIRSLLDEVNDIYECSDGSEVLSEYAKCLPDWVLMDIKMKRMNGIAATKELIAQYPDARVMMLTQYNDKELREAARLAGASDYVCKENLIEARRILSDYQKAQGVSAEK